MLYVIHFSNPRLMSAQEAVFAGVAGEELAVLNPSAVVLAGNVIGNSKLEVKCRSLAHTLVNTLGPSLGWILFIIVPSQWVPVRTTWTPNYCQQDQEMHGLVVHVSGVGNCLKAKQEAV